MSDDDSLDESAVEMFNALVGDGRTACPLAALAEACSLSQADAESAVSQLERAGLVVSWENDRDVPVVTLSTETADAIGVRIDGPRWVGRKVRESNVRIKQRALELNPDITPGKAPTPHAEVEAIEAVYASATTQRLEKARTEGARFRRTEKEIAGHLPEPSKLLMGMGRQWDSRPVVRCPVCEGKKLDAATYCLKCDRWGLDGLLPKAPSKASGKAVAKFTPKATRKVKQAGA